MAALAAQCLIDETPAAQRRLRLSAAKAQVSAACQFVGEQAIQIHGGIGMTDELALSHQVRRLLAIERSRGDRFHHLGVLTAGVMQGAGLYV
jgi:alkylation response protein AidB-like acyl-CoA dehydrogenase